MRLFYGQPSVYCWWDDAGTCRDICQAEGCEQGDALAPALLERAAAELRPGEELPAYLDDLYVITSSARAKPALDVVATRVEEHRGIASNVGKTRIYNSRRSGTVRYRAWRPRGVRRMAPGLRPLLRCHAG